MRPEALHSFVTAVAQGMGSEVGEAVLMADQLVGANLSGHDSHGVGMLPVYVERWLKRLAHPNRELETVIDTGVIVVVDGQHGFGQSTAHRATQIAIDRAKVHGVAVVGLRNSFHIGRIGHWAELAAARGLVSIHFVNVSGHEPIVAPFGGGSARFGTNPFCVAIPGRGSQPTLLLDMATSKIAHGKARVAFSRGEPVPHDSLLDHEGRVTTDPGVFFASGAKGGALIAMGEHKGSGLAIVCELLGAALIGGLVTSPESNEIGGIVNNMLSITIDPMAMGTGNTLVAEAEQYLAYMKSSELREGFTEVLAPGEPEVRSRLARAADIPIDPALLRQLEWAAGKAGVPEAVSLLS